jgi:transglutaminase-like putative cysteine protease
MKYRVTHTTEYHYGESVPLSHNLVHLHPRDTSRQTCISNAIAITPAPALRRDRIDFFGNHMSWFSVQEPHDGLRVESRSEVEVNAFEQSLQLRSITWDQTAATLINRRDAATLDARQFTFDSTYIPRHAALADYARSSFGPARSLLDAVLELTQRIYQEFKFQAGATTVGTPILDVLRDRRGVCQDFAHLQIGCLRSLGLAARYVSGYLLTHPPAGRPPLAGADASHAWVSVYFPDFGWLDLDPTNGVVPSLEHVTVGWARDYDDISPVKGVIVGARRHDLAVSVTVAPIGSPAAAGKN